MQALDDARVGIAGRCLAGEIRWTIERHGSAMVRRLAEHRDGIVHHALVCVGDRASGEGHHGVGRAVDVQDVHRRVGTVLGHRLPERSRNRHEADEAIAAPARQGPGHHAAAGEACGEDAPGVDVEPGRRVGEDGIDGAELDLAVVEVAAGRIADEPAGGRAVQRDQRDAQPVRHAAECGEVHDAGRVGAIAVAVEDCGKRTLALGKRDPVSAAANGAIGLGAAGERGAGGGEKRCADDDVGDEREQQSHGQSDEQAVILPPTLLARRAAARQTRSRAAIRWHRPPLPSVARAAIAMRAREGATMTDAQTAGGSPTGDAPGTARDVALIVGAGPGFSGSVARKLADRGWTVALASRTPETELAEAIGGRAYTLDAGDAETTATLFEAVDRDLGPPRFVMYNPSARVRGALTELEPDAVERALRIMAFGAFLVAQQAAQRMVAMGGGQILLTGATASVKGMPTSASFAMGKFAMPGLAQSMARELQPKGIHTLHVIIDGAIEKPGRAPPSKDAHLDPDAIADAALAALDQQRSAWTWELELRPWVEPF